MIALKEAIAFVRRNGNRLDQLRLSIALCEPFTHAEAEKSLSSYQFPNGSWDYEPKDKATDRVGSLGGTIHCLRWVREFELGQTQTLAQTLKFLESIQTPDGSFYETEEKLAHSPQDWLQEEALIDRFYFTAAVPMRLFSLGYQEHTVFKSAIRWLARHWTDWALVTGTWYNLWALLCIYPATDRLSAPQYQRCYDTALEWLPSLESQPLTWLMDALRWAGYSKSDPLIMECITRLVKLQGENGLWGERNSTAIETTITALRILLDLGSIHIHEH